MDIITILDDENIILRAQDCHQTKDVFEHKGAFFMVKNYKRVEPFIDNNFKYEFTLTKVKNN